MEDMGSAPTGEDHTGGTLQPVLLTAKDVGRLLRCSPRTVSRLAETGRMPAPVRLGKLVRWSRRALDGWLAEGCPSCKSRR